MVQGRVGVILVFTEILSLLVPAPESLALPLLSPTTFLWFQSRCSRNQMIAQVLAASLGRP